jgi:recombinational DNA repair protein RecR
MTTEGDYTADCIRDAIRETAATRNIPITLPGRGFSTGVELEYSDKDTIKNALQNRFKL